MNVNTLPEIILARIFQCVCNVDDINPNIGYSAGKWKSKVAILSVCKLWRELALPNVHRQSFFSCIHTKMHMMLSDSTIASQFSLSGSEALSDLDEQSTSAGLDIVDEPNPTDETSTIDKLSAPQVKTCVVETNLDIISNTGNRIWPQSIHIFIRTGNDPLHSFLGLIERIRGYTTLLVNVQKIFLVFEPLPGDGSWTNNLASIIESGLLGNEFCQLVPNVKFLEWWPGTNAPVMLEFAKMLGKGYAHKLVGFKCPQIALENIQSFSEKLKIADICGNIEYTSYMPKIHAENLTILDLKYMTSNFNWRSFETNGDTQTLKFDNLKWLRIVAEVDLGIIDEEGNEWGYFAREFKYKINAPKLEIAILQLCPFTLSVLSSIYGLAKIEYVELKMDEAHICLKNFNIYKARSTFSSYAKNSQAEYQTINMYSYMNDFYSIHDLADNTSARVWIDGGLPEIDRINWKFLKEIEIYCMLHIKDLRKLVSKLPSLEKMSIRNIELKQNNKLTLYLQDDGPVEPVASVLKKMTVARAIGCTDDDMDKLRAYINMMLPGCKLTIG